MNIENTVRPVLCTTGHEPCQGAWFGSGVLVKKQAHYFVTAFHTLDKYGKHVRDLRIIARLGSDQLIPQRHGIRSHINDTHCYEDIIVVRLDSLFIVESGLDDQFWELSNNDCNLQVGEEAIILGYPEPEQTLDFENNMGTYCPILFKGRVSAFDNGEKMVIIDTPPSIPLSSFNDFSGGAVYKMNQNHPLGISLGGILLQGGRTANILRALSVSCLMNLISYYEAHHLKDDLLKDKLLRMKQDSDAPQGPNS